MEFNKKEEKLIEKVLQMFFDKGEVVKEIKFESKKKIKFIDVS